MFHTLTVNRVIKFMCENVMFVFFGCEDIVHRVLFLKNKLCQHLNVCTLHFVVFYFICPRNARYKFTISGS
jgi:hypothetical protein